MANVTCCCTGESGQQPIRLDSLYINLYKKLCDRTGSEYWVGLMGLCSKAVVFLCTTAAGAFEIFEATWPHAPPAMPLDGIMMHAYASTFHAGVPCMPCMHT